MQKKTISHHHLMPSQSGAMAAPAHLPGCMSTRTIVWSGTSLWSVGVSSPSCVPSQFLVHCQPNRWWGSVSGSKALDAV